MFVYILPEKYKFVNIYQKKYFLGVLCNMIGKICGFIIILSFAFGLITGNVSALGDAVYEGAGSAISLSLSLVGMMCLWNGLMQVAQSSGMINKAAKVLSPVLKFLFPDAHKKNNGIGEIAASMSANIFGIGNGATPLAIRAMEKLQENNGGGEKASNDCIETCSRKL